MRRGLKKNFVKGPMNTWRIQPIGSHEPKEQPNRALPLGKGWQSHTGNRRRMKNLYTTTKATRESQEEKVIDALLRIRDGIKQDPQREYAFLHLVFMAQQVTFDTGIAIEESIAYIMDRWDAEKEDLIKTIKEVEDEKDAERKDQPGTAQPEQQG